MRTRPAFSFVVCAAIAVIAAAQLAAQPANPPKSPASGEAPRAVADTIVQNGRILVFQGIERGGPTQKPKFEEAMAIAGGRILFVGPAARVKSYAGPSTRVVDLHGRTVIPGIVDGHFHGTRLTDCEMGYDGGTVQAILAKLQKCLDDPSQARFKGTNTRFNASHFFGEATVPIGTPLTRDDLDRLDTKRPVMVRNADGHKFWLNSRAIANAAIDEKTPVPSGSEIGRDAKGRPNGFFADYDLPDTWGAEVTRTTADRHDLIRRTNADANRMGITSVFVPGAVEDDIAEWAALRDQGGMTLRANLALSASFAVETADPAELQKKIVALDAYKKYAGGPIAVTSVKIYCDGVMEYPAQTGAMLKPYNVNVGTRDKPVWKPGTGRGQDPSCSQGRAGFVALDKANWQIHVHAIGDRATRDALDNFQAAAEANGARDLRHTITHLEAIDPADIPRFAKLGVIASMSLQWARRDAYLVTGTVGYIEPERYDRLFPAAELWRSGAVVAGGSDYPVDPLLPFVQIETAIDHTGEAVAGVFPGALSPKEVVPDVLAVIRMHTINSAYQMHQEKEFGSLETGKYADFIVLSQDPLGVPVEKISETRVLETWLGGNVVYRSDGAGAMKAAAQPAACTSTASD